MCQDTHKEDLLGQESKTYLIHQFSLNRIKLRVDDDDDDGLIRKGIGVWKLFYFTAYFFVSKCI